MLDFTFGLVLLNYVVVVSCLYTQFVSIYVNFQMKRKDISSDRADLGLNNGCAYFIEEKAYKTWLNGHKDEVQEVCLQILNNYF